MTMDADILSRDNIMKNLTTKNFPYYNNLKQLKIY